MKNGLGLQWQIILLNLWRPQQWFGVLDQMTVNYQDVWVFSLFYKHHDGVWDQLRRHRKSSVAQHTTTHFITHSKFLNKLLDCTKVLNQLLHILLLFFLSPEVILIKSSPGLLSFFKVFIGIFGWLFSHSCILFHGRLTKRDETKEVASGLNQNTELHRSTLQHNKIQSCGNELHH